MLDLIKELLHRHWDFDYTDECLRLVYRNGERLVTNDDEAKSLLDEILDD